MLCAAQSSFVFMRKAMVSGYGGAETFSCSQVRMRSEIMLVPDATVGTIAPTQSDNAVDMKKNKSSSEIGSLVAACDGHVVMLPGQLQMADFTKKMKRENAGCILMFSELFAKMNCFTISQALSDWAAAVGTLRGIPEETAFDVLADSASVFDVRIWFNSD